MVVPDIRYQYYRDRHGAPRVTLCRIRTEDGHYGYGWSICTDPSPHPADRMHNDIRIRGGRSIARGRAEAALKNRGVQCHPFLDASCWIFHRPIRRVEALAVLEECQAAAMLYFLTTRNTKWLSQAMRPDMGSRSDTHVKPQGTPSPQHPQIFQSIYLRAGADANELARLEMLEAQQATDAAGYLQTPTVYSEVLERFVPENEAL